MSKDETVADITAEMRSVPVCVAWTKSTLAETADRIEAAHKREVADILGHCPKNNGTCPNGDGTCPNDGERHGVVGTGDAAGQPTQVTAELREWITSSVDPAETDLLADTLAIADRIDEAVANMVPLPVRIKARQELERENSRLYGMLSDMENSRNAERVKRQRLAHYRNLYLSMLRDARDEYVALHNDYRQLSRDYRAMHDERDTMLHMLHDKLAALRDACSVAVSACEKEMRDE